MRKGVTMNNFLLEIAKSDDLRTVEYYGSQLEKPTTETVESEPLAFGLDWLEINFTGDFQGLQSNDEFKITPLEYHSRHFKTISEISWRSKKIGELKYNPYSSIIDSDIIKLKISNEWFYIEQDIRPIIYLLQSVYKLKFKSISRADIYIDCQSIKGLTPIDIYKGLTIKAIINKGKAFARPYHNDPRSMEVTGFTIGSRTSKNKYLRCYNKTLEMQKTSKEYIQNHWNQIGFEANKPVYRIEVQLNVKFWSEYLTTSKERLNWESVFSGKILAKLYKLALQNFFDLMVNIGRSEKNKNKPFEWIDYQRIEDLYDSWIYGIVKVSRDSQKNSPRSKRIILKGLFRAYYEHGQDALMLRALYAFIDLHNHDLNMAEYFNQKAVEWTKEFERDGLFVDVFDWEYFYYQTEKYVLWKV